jgi:hypothetical protein
MLRLKILNHKIKDFKKILLFTVILLFIFKNSYALKKENTNSIENWTYTKTKPSKRDICYAVTYSKKRIGNFKAKTDKPYIIINYIDEYRKRISVFNGYKARKGSSIKISVGNKTFTLSSYENFGITKSFQDNDDIIAKMFKSNKMLVRAESENGSYTVDEYDLSGFGKVYSKLQISCG